MPVFIPPYLGDEVKSNAERKVFEVLQELELKNAVVLHSLGLPRHRSKVYGEIDFVVVCDRGVACLEIKGGGVSCVEGRWLFTDRYGVEREKPEGPFAQVTGNMFSLREALKKRFPDHPHIKDVLVACGVMFPDITFRSRGQEIIPEIVYDKSSESVTGYLNGVFNYWEGRTCRRTGTLSPTDISAVVSYLRGEFRFVPTLRDRLDRVEERLIRLTEEQSLLLDALGSNSHLLIEGGAGTGKTMLASHFAGEKATEGLRVLYLAFNKNLVASIRRQMPEGADIKVINLHALFGEYIPIDVARMQADPGTYFSEELPETFYEYLGGLSATELDGLQYDLLVIDEAQDILRPIYLFSLDLLLRGGLEKGRWAVFFDEKQNIYNDEFAEGLELLTSYECTRFRLYVNCRNTVQIGRYSALESGTEQGAYIRENGEEVRTERYGDEKSFKELVQRILKELRGEGVDLCQVVFLSPRRYPRSMMTKAGVTVNEVRDGFDGSLDQPLYATIQGFKGLDAMIVILVDMEQLSADDYSQFVYIAATRARTLLYVLRQE